MNQNCFKTNKPEKQQQQKTNLKLSQAYSPTTQKAEAEA
jgi:hypothetical protein